MGGGGVRRAGGALAVALVLAGCGRDPTTAGERAHRDDRPRASYADASTVERRAFVAARMAEAGEAYALRASGEGAEARHPSMPLDARFDERGVTLADRSNAWAGRWRVSSIGRDGSLRALAPVGPRVRGNRAAYARDGSTEWYLHGPLGIEQGLTLDARPDGAGPLVIEVDLGALRPEIDGDRVELAEAGGVRLVMSDLFAVDGEGAPLDARFAVRDGRLRYVVRDEGAAYPIEIDPLVAVPEQILTEASPSPSDSLGWAVAVDGDTAVVGAPLDDHAAGSNAGSGYVFVRSGSTWTLQAVLRASGGATEDRLGYSVALHGDTAILGARSDNHSGYADAGSATVFVRSGTAWTEQATLVASDPGTADAFGHAVAVDGDTAVVGAYTASYPGVTNGGSAYVFTRSGSTWTEQAILRPSDADSFDRFGSAVDVDGDTAVIGAEQDDHSGLAEGGSAYVFVRSGSAWSEQAILRASDATHFAYFGTSVAADGDTVLVGAYGHMTSGFSSAGSVYAFVRAGTTWSEQAILVSGDIWAGDLFGTSVSLAGDAAVVGAPGVDWSGVNRSGSAYVFERSGSAWFESVRVRPPTPMVDGLFGMSVALSLDTALIGAPAEEVSATTDAGRAHAYGLRSAATPCSAPSDCTSGFCVDGVCCDTACGGGSTSDCQACAVAAGAAIDGVCGPVAGGSVCRSAAGPCDVAEHCDGTSTACPADALASATTVCRAAPGACDVEERCTGTSPSCPPNAYASSSTVCRPAASDCDAAERCTGFGPSCPGDLPEPSGVVCRAAAGDCDVAETCTGLGFDCPPDALLGAGTVCRPATGDCDAAESCTGAAAACPTDGAAPDGTACDDGMTCTATSVCTSGACAGAPMTCDDGDPCTADGCAEPGGCFHTPIAGCDVDAGVPSDGGTPPIDAGAPDAGTPIDAGPTIDAGALDAGGSIDAGSIIDAGAVRDATVDVDAGDAGDASAPEDASGTDDAAIEETDAGMGSTPTGCSCRAATGGSARWPALLPLALALVLRRRRRPPSRR